VGSSEAGTALKQVLERVAFGPEPERTTKILAHPELGRIGRAGNVADKAAYDPNWLFVRMKSCKR
jgi:hypothetical protein